MRITHPDEVKLLTTAEVAKLFGITSTSVYQWTLKGCPVKIEKGKYLFRLQDVIAWQKGRKS
jgi:phage terminase Nu1 subunit (DNA packaging protein)